MEKDFEEKVYVFRINEYDEDMLLPQVSAALEKRLEMVSRERYHGLWKQTDRLRSVSGPRRNRLPTKVLCWICLLLGLFLLIPCLVNPQELTGPLLVGIFGVIAGILGLWNNRKNRKNPFDKSARILLQGKGKKPSEPSEIRFSEEGMWALVGSEESEKTPYDKFECMIEAEDIILIVFGERVLLLQKFDLINGAPEEFCSFCAEKVQKYQKVN